MKAASKASSARAARRTVGVASKTFSIDDFANLFFQTVVESVANTMEFQEINFNLSLQMAVGILLHRVEYYIPAAELQKVLAADDVIEFGLTTSKNLTTFDLSDGSVIDMGAITVNAATIGDKMVSPFIRDFSQLPMGGRLVYPKPLYLAVSSASIGTVVTVQCRGFYTFIDISDQTAFELMQLQRLTSA